MAANGISYDWSFIPKLLLSFMASSALIIGCVSLAMSITGTLISNIIVSFIILGLPRFLLFVADRFIIGATTRIFVDISKFGVFLNPAYNIPTAIILDITRKWEYFGVSEILIRPGSILYTFILGIIYLGAGLLLMKKRKSELAGKGAPSKMLGHIISAAIALPFLAYGFYSLITQGVFNLTNYADTQKCIIFLILGFLIFIIFEFVLLRNLKSLVKSIPIFVVTLIITLGFIYTQNKISIKVNNYIPESNEIEYIKIDENYAVIHKYKPLYTYKNLLTKDIEFANPELVSLMHDSLAKTVDADNERREFGYINRDASFDVYCEFKLKSGKSVYRNLEIFNEDYNEIKDLVTSNAEYYRLSYLIPPLSEVDSTTLYSSVYVDENFSDAIYKSFINEYENADLDSKNNIIFRQNSTYYFWPNSWIASEDYYNEVQFAQFYVSGKINSYNFKNYYYINRFVPKTASLYFNEINKLLSESFTEDMKQVKENSDENLRYWLNFEVVNAGDSTSNIPLGITMIYNNTEDNPGGYITDAELYTILDMITQENLENISLDLPIVKMTMNHQSSDYSEYKRYDLYAQLSSEELQTFYDIFLNKLK